MAQLTLGDISKAITQEVVDRAFKLKTKSAESVQNISVTRAAPVGEGLLGAVYRIRAIGRNNAIAATFVAKGLVRDKLLRKTLNCPQYFRREIIFFSKILPALLAIQKKLGAKENLQCSIPICYELLCDGANDYLLLEDLLDRGYISIPKNPTVSERNATLKTLAHFHAVSFALRINEPDIFIKIANELHEIYYYEANRSWYNEYLQKAIELDKAALAEYENPETSKYYKKFTELLNKDVYSQLINLVTEQSDNPVFCHGDSWCANFLYSSGKSVIIDFQLVRCASPVTDLVYFLIVSNLCRNKENFKDAIDIYYSALQYYLADMNLKISEIFPRSSVDAELKKYGKFGLLASLSSFPLLASERCDTLKSYNTDFQEYDRIPLVKLWRLTPFQTEEDKKQLVNAVRVAVDAGLI